MRFLSREDAFFFFVPASQKEIFHSPNEGLAQSSDNASLSENTLDLPQPGNQGLTFPLRLVRWPETENPRRMSQAEMRPALTLTGTQRATDVFQPL